MSIENKDLKARIIDISYSQHLSHLGSNLTAVDIIDEIYDQKKDNEPFVLSSGHAGLALYTVLEQRGGRNAEEIFNHHGVHPDRCGDCGLDCSTGSLGQGLPIALGMALSSRDRRVWCLISDGECAEGSIWEAFRVMDEEKIDNLKVYINMNGWGAYRKVNGLNLPASFSKMVNLRWTNTHDFPFLKGQDAHYKVLSNSDYRQAQEILR